MYQASMVRPCTQQQWSSHQLKRGRLKGGGWEQAGYNDSDTDRGSSLKGVASIFPENFQEIFCWTGKMYLFIKQWKQLKTLEKFLFVFKVQFKYSIAVNASNVYLTEIKINIKQ